MQFRLLSIVLVTCLGAPASAQDPADFQPKPAAELQKLAPMVGTWEGSGSVWMAPGADAMPWTSKSSFEWVLAGHWLREDINIQLGDMPTPLSMTTFYGWDAENQRYVSIGISNTGDAELNEVHMVDGSMVTMSAGLDMGSPSLERWVTTCKDGVSTIEGHAASGTGEMFTHVSGSSKRTSEKPSKVTRADAPLMPEFAEMKAAHHAKLASAAGDYSFTGWMVMPGAGKMDIMGNESFRPILGGMVLEFHSESEPVGMYEGYSWMSWNEHDQCFDFVMVDSMGQSGRQQCRLMGDTWVFTGTGNYGGEPTVFRAALKLNDDGSFGSFDSHSIAGVTEPVHSFHAKYTRKKAQ